MAASPVVLFHQLPAYILNPTSNVIRIDFGRVAFGKNWNDDAASFECSDEILNQIWELCRDSNKATTFAGVYIDGDRRISEDVCTVFARAGKQIFERRLWFEAGNIQRPSTYRQLG